MSKLLLYRRPNETDKELAIEDECREEAVRAVVGDQYWVTNDGQTAWPARGVGFDARPVLSLPAMPVYGAIPVGGTFPTADQLADRYHLLGTFHKYAGRATVVAAYDADKTLVRATQDMLATYGVARVKVMAKAKYATWVLDRRGIPRDITSLSSVEAWLWEKAEFALEHLADRPDAFLVQAEVPMRYEYRLFVVGHRVVTGAGCIEKHTPRDNGDGAFDQKIQFVRDDRSAVFRDPGVVTDLVQFGCNVAAEIAIERPAMSEYALDVTYVGLGRGSRPGIVELNGLRNSGLYASQPQRVVEALVARHGE